MENNPLLQAQPPVGLAQAQAFQDQLISTHLPVWLRSATHEQMTALADALRLSQYFYERVSQVLAGIVGIDTFASARLEQALSKKVGAAFEAHRWRFRVGHREPVINSQPVGVHLTELVYRDMPLLEAALRNFTKDETLAGGQPKGNALTPIGTGTIKPPSASELATLCRALDLGGLYQRYLEQSLRPVAGETGGGANAPSLMARAYRYSMLADAHKARLTGVLNDDELQWINRLCQLHSPEHLANRPVRAKQLSLLGCELEQIVVLDIIDQGVLRNTSWRVLVYIPGDAQGAWSAYPDLRRFANALGKRLRTADYQHFFSRFVRRRHSQRFFSAVQRGYDGVSDLANIALEEHMSVYAQPLFDTLANARIEQIKDDAAMIAVPTAAVDREVQRAHDQRLAAEGWALLNIAGLFVPVIGITLLAVSVVELLGEVYHGAQAWHDGDTSEALDHLLNVATDLAAMGATVAGVTAARAAWTRSRFVDGLVPAYLEDGTVKLSKPELEPERQATLPAGLDEDAEGVLRQGEQAWVTLEGQHYPAVQRASDGQWQLQAYQGRAPQLFHNGAGAWRLWFEQPAGWQTLQLFQRLGSAFAQLDEARVEQVLLIQDMTEDHLRAVQVNAWRPGAELTDSVIRAQLDQRIDRLIEALEDDEPVTDTLMQSWASHLEGTQGLPGRSVAEHLRARRRVLFDQAYADLPVEQVPGMATLRRQFPALHERGAAELLQAASVGERRRVLDEGRVPLRLAETARLMARRIRAARAVEGIFVEAPQHADLARLALGLGNEAPGWAEGCHWRLLEGSLQGAVLVSHGQPGSAEAFDLVHLGGTFQLHHGQGDAIGEAGELFDVLAQALDETRRERLGIRRAGGRGLQTWMRQRIGARRGEVGQMLGLQPSIGWWQPPRRLLDGRIGYPLNGRSEGRGRPTGLFAVVRLLYPGFNDAQVLAWVNDVHRSGHSVEQRVAQLAREIEALDIELHNWSRRASDAAQRTERRYFRETLINCWRRRATAGGNHEDVPSGYRLSVWSVQLGSLPSLPQEVSFAHVRELSLLEMGLAEVPSDFLRAFPNLATLELSNNRLTRLPAGLTQMQHLTRLDLYRNAVVLDAEQAMLLGNCEHLEYINLSYNPLGRAFPLYRLERLRRLHLRATGISEFPAGLLDRLELLTADLRDNQISRLPRHFYRSPIWISSSVMLEDNPLAAEEAERLQIFMQANAIPEVLVAPGEGMSASRQQWLDASDSLTRGQQSSAWDELSALQGSDDFFNMLLLLQDSAEFQQRPQALANRVFAMIRAMIEHPNLAEELLGQATETLHCQDGAALCFSNLELHMLVWRARVDAEAGGHQASLLRLGRQLWRLDRLDQVVLADIQARQAEGGDPDQIEVGLAYRLTLRDEFDLPAQPADMLFAAVSGVDEARIEHARQSLLADETAETLADSLVARTFWQDHLVAANRERFDALDAPFHERLEALTNEAHDGNEADYGQRMNNIRDERDQARRGLLHALTLPLLHEVSGQSTAASGNSAGSRAVD